MNQQPPSFEPSHRRQRPGTPAQHGVQHSPGQAGHRSPAGDQRGARPQATSRNHTNRDSRQPMTYLPPGAAIPPEHRPEQPGQNRVGPGQPVSAQAGPGQPSENRRPSHPGAQPASPGQVPPGSRPTRTKKRKRKRRGPKVLALLLILLLAWPVGLLVWADSKLNKVIDLAGQADTDGTTYLLVGSDSRENTEGESSVMGARSDTIMLLHKPTSGATSLISLPRDTYVDIAGYGPNKLNASYSFEGPQLLADTVSELTGLGIDHYVELGFGDLQYLVDAVDGLELCYDHDFYDSYTDLEWQAGCHEVDGKTALDFSRMRYQDPEGDIGRGKRQRQVVAKITDKILTPETFVNPMRQRDLINAGTAAFGVDEDTSVLDIAMMALAFRSANGPNGFAGAPPIELIDYRPGGVGSTVLLSDDAGQFFADVSSGEIEPN